MDLLLMPKADRVFFFETQAIRAELVADRMIEEALATGNDDLLVKAEGWLRRAQLNRDLAAQAAI